MAEEKSPAEVRKMRKSLNQRFSHNTLCCRRHKVYYRRAKSNIWLAIPPALKCLRNWSSVNKP